MLVNVPDAEELNGIALRLYFDAWGRTVSLMSDFGMVFETVFDGNGKPQIYVDEWNDYLIQAQPEMGAICATIQHSAELRLKSIICQVSPYLLLLDGNFSFRANSQNDIDFADQRTLDAVDLPRAVRTLTAFDIPDSYVESYGKLRQRRNRVTHLGTHEGGLTPNELVRIMGEQYVSLWPDGRWLVRRVQFDGNSATRFFHDGRYSSAHSTVMEELPYTMVLLDNGTFKKAFGISKGKLKGFCPGCVFNLASKVDFGREPTAYRTGKSSGKCAMCDRLLLIHKEDDECPSCQSHERVEGEGFQGSVCFSCGDS